MFPTGSKYDILSGVAADNVGMDVCVKFGGSIGLSLRDIWGADFVSKFDQKEVHPRLPNTSQ